MSRVPVDLSGKRFGMLVALQRRGNKGASAAWLCKCDCGEQKIISGSNLRSGLTNSCGCREGLGVPPRELTNQRFGKLVVLSLVSVKPPIWRCKCDCGNTVTLRSSYLLGSKQDCGCSYRGGVPQQIGGRAAALKLRKRPFEALYNSLHRRADNKRLEVLTYEEFLEFTTIQNCHYCGDGLVWAKYSLGRNGRAANLDRKDSGQGYTKGNVVVCCIRCNKAKLNHFTYDEWVKIGTFIRDNIRRVNL